MKDLLIRGHLGLGDMLIINGLVRHFAAFEPNRFIHVLCKAHNVPTVECMFSDLETVEVKSVKDDLEADKCAQEFEDDGIAEILRLSGSGDGFDKQFYDCAGVPFEERWTRFRWGTGRGYIEPPLKPYSFVHEDAERGFRIDYARVGSWIPLIVRPNRVLGDGNLFAWTHVLDQAREIHCIPSAFSVLVDSIPLAGDGDLYLHKYARPGGELPTYRKNWKVLT